MGKAWGKLPYPAFMETTDCVIFGRGDGDVRELWRGKCYFGWRRRRRQERDGLSEELAGWASFGRDIRDELGGYGSDDLEFLVDGKRFLVDEVRWLFNPDGSFHHLRFGLGAVVAWQE